MIGYSIKRTIFAFAFLLMSVTAFAGSRDEQTANVAVYVQTFNGQTTYIYSIRNSGNRPILGFSVGFDHYTGASEISGAHPVEVISPATWQSRVITLEESPYYEVRWEPIPGEDNLHPGSTMNGFTIVMREPNQQLRTGHWTAIIDGPPTYASSRIEVLSAPPVEMDTVPPSITVTVDPSVIWPANNKMVKVTANVTAIDNRDPAPIISMDSVTCSECNQEHMDISGAEVGTADFYFEVRAAREGQTKLGRVYTVTYSATDAAGNKSTASAIISVPHDQRQK